jgi:hypothetical protein
VRSRRRNLGALEAGTEETVPPGVTRLQGGVARLQGEGLPQEEGHLQGEGVLLAGKRGEAMQEVGDVEVEVEALLQDEALHQEGVPLQGVAHLQEGVPLQGVEEVLTMEVEVDLGGLGLQGEVMTGALQEGDRLQGEVPPLAGDLRHVVGLLLGEVRPHAGDLHLAGMRAAATEVPGGAEEVGLHLEEAHHPAVMDLLVMKVLQTGGATVQLATRKHLQDPTTAHRLNLMTKLLPSPLASLMKAGPRWPSVKPTWSSHLGRFDLRASPAFLPWPPPLLGVAS